MAGYYNKDKDYSKELMRTDLSSSERAQLTQERQNKIDAVYGGKEPTLADGSGKTYNQKYGGSSSHCSLVAVRAPCRTDSKGAQTALAYGTPIRTRSATS